MNVSESDFQYMLECQERDIATLLVEELHMTIENLIQSRQRLKFSKAFLFPL